MSAQKEILFDGNRILWRLLLFEASGVEVVHVCSDLLIISLYDSEKKRSEMVPKVGLGTQEVPRYVQSAI